MVHNIAQAIIDIGIFKNPWLAFGQGLSLWCMYCFKQSHFGTRFLFWNKQNKKKNILNKEYKGFVHRLELGMVIAITKKTTNKIT